MLAFGRGGGGGGYVSLRRGGGYVNLGDMLALGEGGGGYVSLGGDMLALGIF